MRYRVMQPWGRAPRPAKHPDGNFALTLAELLAEGLIDSSFTSDGRYANTPYRITLTGTRDESGRVVAYQVSAMPLEPRGSCPSFYTDQEGPITRTYEARPATANDSAIQ